MFKYFVFCVLFKLPQSAYTHTHTQTHTHTHTHTHIDTRICKHTSDCGCVCGCVCVCVCVCVDMFPGLAKYQVFLASFRGTKVLPLVSCALLKERIASLKVGQRVREARESCEKEVCSAADIPWSFCRISLIDLGQRKKSHGRD
jgi:hypothetical protein